MPPTLDATAQLALLDDHELLQIEMAARGCVSGTLSEWPHLHRALGKVGQCTYPPATPVSEIRRLCRALWVGWQAPVDFFDSRALTDS